MMFQIPGHIGHSFFLLFYTTLLKHLHEVFGDLMVFHAKHLVVVRSACLSINLELPRMPIIYLIVI